jgi:hypothetical protein
MSDHPEPDPDDALIAELQTLVARVDPVPPLVTEAAKAALGWRRLDADLAELLSDSALESEALALARGPGAPVRSVSFSAGELTIDIEIHEDGGERTVLGQLSPPSSDRIEIQRADDADSTIVESDHLGRFRAQVSAGRPIRVRVVGQDRGGVASVIETSWIAI